MTGVVKPVTGQFLPAKGGVGMRSKIAISLLIGSGFGSSFGCYVQPYNPPPAQYGQAQTQPAQPPPQQQPGYAEQPPPPPPDQQQPPPPPAYQPPPPVAQPAAPPAPVYSGPIYDDVSVDVAGSNVPSIDVFYNDLAPYGSWYEDPTYGWVFAPPSPTYTPYSNGRWVYTDYGYTWVSADPFGWATVHYGRWVWANRWVWRPDPNWGLCW